MDLPAVGDRVEVLLDRVWVQAVFRAADSIASSDPDVDEVWWDDYFELADGTTIPTPGGDLPVWRLISA